MASDTNVQHVVSRVRDKVAVMFRSGYNEVTDEATKGYGCRQGRVRG